MFCKKNVSCHTADSKPVKQEVNGTVILLTLVFPATSNKHCVGQKCFGQMSVGKMVFDQPKSKQTRICGSICSCQRGWIEDKFFGVFQFFSGGRQPVFPDVGGEVPTPISPVDK